ncbi:MAG: 3-phosphoshikimate 1-carboxyvinyltransferase [Bacteroides sp.]|nr:3-phosphoshikimate 1-carboxyvinyltransferase [Bacteroides sp.]
MRYQITFPTTIHTTVQLPTSKSISNRVLIINALAKGKHKIHNLSDCDDTRVMRKGLIADEWESVDIMAAGTAMRFLTAYFSVTPGYHYLTGTERMKQRPIWVLVDALRRLGADIDYVEEDGYPPLEINGKKLSGDKIALQGDISSQYISALLMIAPTLKHGLNLFLIGKIISRPYINMTMQLMREFGAELDWNTENSIIVQPTPYKSVPYTVEADWSAASYWYQMVALSERAEVELLGLKENSAQGDSRVAELFEKLGVDTTFVSRGVMVKKSERAPVDYLELDFQDFPDLAQTFVVTCSMMEIPFRFTGLDTLKIKETDRVQALVTEMKKLGINLRVEDSTNLIWDGKRKKADNLPSIQTYEDHRMAMAFAPAASRYVGLQIDEPSAVTKSYPRFWDDLRTAGVVIREN